MCCNRHGCVEEILTIAAMLSVDNAIFYHPRVSNLIIFVCGISLCGNFDSMGITVTCRHTHARTHTHTE